MVSIFVLIVATLITLAVVGAIVFGLISALSSRNSGRIIALIVGGFFTITFLGALVAIPFLFVARRHVSQVQVEQQMRMVEAQMIAEQQRAIAERNQNLIPLDTEAPAAAVPLFAPESPAVPQPAAVDAPAAPNNTPSTQVEPTALTPEEPMADHASADEPITPAPSPEGDTSVEDASNGEGANVRGDVPAEVTPESPADSHDTASTTTAETEATTGIAESLQAESTSVPQDSATEPSPAVASDGTADHADGGASQPAPDWLGAPPSRSGELHYDIVSVGPYVTPAECYKQLQTQLDAATEQYVQWYVTQMSHMPGLSGSARSIGIRTPRIDEQADTYLQGRQYGVGYMYTLHGRIKFDQAFREHVDEQLRNSVTMGRLTITGMASGSVLCAVASLFGLFRLRAAWS